MILSDFFRTERPVQRVNHYYAEFKYIRLKYFRFFFCFVAQKAYIVPSGHDVAWTLLCIDVILRRCINVMCRLGFSSLVNPLGLVLKKRIFPRESFFCKFSFNGSPHFV